MLYTCCRIEIEGLFFEFANEVEINRSWKNFTDTCTIKQPRMIRSYKGARLDKAIKRGDRVAIDLGYNGRYDSVFRGYVTGLKPTYPVEITCEDEMYLLKQCEAKPKTFKAGTTVTQILDHMKVGDVMPYKTFGDITVGQWQITPDMDTAAKVLRKLKDDFNLASFIRETELVVGDPYDYEYGQKVIYGFGKNIITHNLEYRRKEDIQLQVKCISKRSKGKDVTVTKGDLFGDKKTMHYFNKTKAELEVLAQRDLDRLKYTGYKGDFTTFGEPVARHGYIAVLVDPDEEKSGEYWIDGVKTTFGMNGYRRIVTLGPNAANNTD